MARTLSYRSEKVGGELLIRPADFPAWRTALDASEIEDKARYHLLLDILENDEKQYMLISFF
jgi:hypothetical protein